MPCPAKSKTIKANTPQDNNEGTKNEVKREEKSGGDHTQPAAPIRSFFVHHLISLLMASFGSFFISSVATATDNLHRP